jgi:glycosyltransferase involved in cell wall biosynthesis
MKHMMARAGRQAAVLFSDSEYTRNQAIHYLGVDPNKTFVCYQNCSPIFQPVRDAKVLADIRRIHRLPQHYIFAPISLSPRKNLERILAAFEAIKGEVPHSLVITGGQSWGTRSLRRRIDATNDHRIQILGGVPHEHLPALYSMASFTVYTSLLEGFGMPILEAFHCGCPVLTSKITSMPEVAGEAARLVDPYDINQIANGILELASDDDLREDLIYRGFIRARLFSWEKTASVILDGLIMGEEDKKEIVKV